VSAGVSQPLRGIPVGRPEVGKAMRTTLANRIEAVETSVQALGQVLRRQLDLALGTLADGSATTADDLTTGELELKIGTAELHWGILQTIALEQPVAGDLRLLAGMLHVTDHLGRMGDLCCNLARSGHRLGETPAPKAIGDLLEEMGGHATRAVQAALDCLNLRDLATAQRLPELDRPLDELNRAVFTRIDQTAGAEGAGRGLAWAVQVVLAARFLERIGDHAVDIAEQVGFILTGEVREFLPPKAERGAGA
jgi:phosphate transport system protein